MGASTIGARESNKQSQGNKQAQTVELQISLLDCYVQDSQQYEFENELYALQNNSVEIYGYAPRLKQITEVIDRQLEMYVNNRDVERIKLIIELPNYYDELHVAFEDIFLRKKKSVHLDGETVTIKSLNLSNPKVTATLKYILTDITEQASKQCPINVENTSTNRADLHEHNADTLSEARMAASMFLDKVMSPIVDTEATFAKLLAIPLAFGFNPRLGSNGLIYLKSNGNQYFKIVGKLSSLQHLSKKIGGFGKIGWLNLLQIPEAVKEVSSAKTKKDATKVVGRRVGGMLGGEIGGHLGWVGGCIIVAAIGLAPVPAVIVIAGCVLTGVVAGTAGGTKFGETIAEPLGGMLEQPEKQRPLSSIPAEISAAPERKTYITAPPERKAYITAAPERKTYMYSATDKYQPLLYNLK